MSQIQNYFICGSLDEAQRNPGLPMPLKSPRIPFHFIRATKRIAWNGKALSRPAYLRIDINISPQRRGDAEEKQIVRNGLVGWALPTVIIMVGKAHPTY